MSIGLRSYGKMTKKKPTKAFERKVQEHLDELVLKGDVALTGVKDGEETYGITKKGADKTERLLRDNVDAQVFFFNLCYNGLVLDLAKCKTPEESISAFATTCAIFEHACGKQFWEVVLHLRR